MMNEKRFTSYYERGNEVVIEYNGKRLSNKQLVDLLNMQQATIQELERKVKKYAKIGEEQLKQIIKLQDELQECRARPTLATDERGVVKVEYR